MYEICSGARVLYRETGTPPACRMPRSEIDVIGRVGADQVDELTGLQAERDKALGEVPDPIPVPRPCNRFPVFAVFPLQGLDVGEFLCRVLKEGCYGLSGDRIVDLLRFGSDVSGQTCHLPTGTGVRNAKSITHLRLELYGTRRPLSVAPRLVAGAERVDRRARVMTAEVETGPALRNRGIHVAENTTRVGQ